MSAGPPNFQFSSPVWPGLAKLSEECGEVVQVIGKIVGTGGTMRFRDGQTVDRSRMVDELADLFAAARFVADHALTHQEHDAMNDRIGTKSALFERWRAEESRPPSPASGEPK
jgi:NTP pyrophosphatase (non-canonical NTP hydrolase)